MSAAVLKGSCRSFRCGVCGRAEDRRRQAQYASGAIWVTALAGPWLTNQRTCGRHLWAQTMSDVMCETPADLSVREAHQSWSAPSALPRRTAPGPWRWRGVWFADDLLMHSEGKSSSRLESCTGMKFIWSSIKVSSKFPLGAAAPCYGYNEHRVG